MHGDLQRRIQEREQGRGGTKMEDTQYMVINEELQRLRDEQQRLRDEQEKQREKTASTNGNGAGGQKDGAHEKDAGKGGEGEKPAEEKDKKEGKGDDKNKEEEKHEPKIPLGQRAREFVHAHPKGILYGVIGFGALCILGFFLLRYLNSYESTDDAEVDGHLNAVS